MPVPLQVPLDCQIAPHCLQLGSASKYMKSVLAFATMCAILLAAGCSQSPEKLLATANKYRADKQYDKASILYQKVLIKDKTNAEAYYRLGLNDLDQGKISEAVQALRRAVDLKPSNTDAEAKLAEIYLLGYRFNPKKNKSALTDAADLASKMLQQNPNSFEGLRIEGLIARFNGDLAKAQESFAKANRVKPYSRNLIDVYAETLVQQGKPDEAIALVNDTLAHDKSWGPGYDFLYVQFARTGQRDKAEGVLKARTEADPNNPIAIENYANYRLAAGDFPGGEKLMLGMVSNPKSFPTARLLLGDFYERAKKPDLALAAYQQGAKDDSKNAVKYNERIVALQASTNHGDQALSLAKDLVDKNPKDATANEMYAELLIRTANRASMNKTLEEIKKLVDNHPANGLLRLDLARAYFGTNDREKALAAAQEAVSDEQKPGQRSRPGVILPAEILQARIYGERGANDDFQKAVDITTRVLEASPQEPDATLIKDRALISMGQGDKALPELEALLQRFPKISEAHILLGNLYLRARQFDKATAQFDAAYKAMPPDPRGFLGLQEVKLYSGHSSEALQALQDLVSKNPNDMTARFQLANFQATAAGLPANQANSKQLLEQAADNFKEVLKTNSGSVEIWLRLGVIQSALGQLDPALASFEQAGTADPKNVQAFMNQALLLDRLNRKKEAADAYSKVLNLQSDNALALNNLAYMSAESGSNLDQAQTYAERAKKKAPDSPDVADTLGYVYLKKNLNKEAADIFRRNVAEHPDNAAFRFHLAMALLKEGDKQGAKEQAGKALQSANPDLQNKIKTFVGQIG